MDKADKIKETELGYSSDSPDKMLENALPAITKSYKVQNLPEVKEFLLTRPNLINILEEVPQKASQYFPANRGITLRLQVDPEDGYEDIVIKILIDLDPDEALDALERFDEEWWLGQETSALLNICLNVDYV